MSTKPSVYKFRMRGIILATTPEEAEQKYLDGEYAIQDHTITQTGLRADKPSTPKGA